MLRTTLSDAKNWLIWKDLDAGKDWRQEEKGMRGWYGWKASPTQWTWVWVNSESWWWTERLGVLQSMGLQRVGHDWATELNWSGQVFCGIDWCLHFNSHCYRCMHAQLFSHVPFFVAPWTVACQAHLSMGLSRQEYWSGLQFLPPGNLPDLGIEPTSPVCPALSGRFFNIEPPGKSLTTKMC